MKDGLDLGDAGGQEAIDPSGPAQQEGGHERREGGEPPVAIALTAMD